MLLLLSILACAPADPGWGGDVPGAVDLERAAEDALPATEPPDAGAITGVPTPCGTAFTTNTRVSVSEQTVDIDRFEGHARVEHIHLGADALERVEHEIIGEPTRCSAIFLVGKDGRRVLFDNHPELDLEPRARRLAEMLGLTLAVVRDDADGAAAPE